MTVRTHKIRGFEARILPLRRGETADQADFAQTFRQGEKLEKLLSQQS